MPTATDLRDKLRLAAESETSEEWRVRLHRAISWLERSEQEKEDADARFVFQWIALNAAYAREFGRAESERERANRFLEQLVELDSSRRLHDTLFRQFSGPIRTLLDNHFVFEPFWTALRDHDSSNRWKTAFASSRKVARLPGWSRFVAARSSAWIKSRGPEVAICRRGPTAASRLL